jgi:hypothetical protein
MTNEDIKIITDKKITGSINSIPVCEIAFDGNGFLTIKVLETEKPIPIDMNQVKQAIERQILETIKRGGSYICEKDPLGLVVKKFIPFEAKQMPNGNFFPGVKTENQEKFMQGFMDDLNFVIKETYGLEFGM